MLPLPKPIAMSIEATLWLLTLGGFATASRLRNDGGHADTQDAHSAVVGVAQSRIDSVYLDSIASSADRIASRDPFRLSHAPATVPYAPERRGAAPAIQSRPVAPRPNLSVRGILGNSNLWRAILVGVPGHSEAVLVNPGDTLGGLRVRRITRDTVFVRGIDTSWALTVRGGWQP